MKLAEPFWIDVAGKPARIRAGTPPYWRYRRTHQGEERLFDDLVINGTFASENHTQGTQIGADFLLWYSLLGTPTVLEENGKTTLRIELAKPKDTSPLPSNAKLVAKNTKIRVFGAPVDVRAGSDLWWETAINQESTKIARFHLYGASSQTNHQVKDDAHNQDPKRHVIWLEFHGDAYLTPDKHLHIELSRDPR